MYMCLHIILSLVTLYAVPTCTVTVLMVCLFQVAKADLRWIVGCSLPDTADSTLEKTLKASGYSLWTFPDCKRAVITEFPYRSFVSCIIAPRIVYPALMRYFEVRTISIVPLCTCNNMCTLYIVYYTYTAVTISIFAAI